MAEFKNPGQQGGQDNKSLLVMMLVMVAVFFGLQYYKTKTNPQTVPDAALTQTARRRAEQRLRSATAAGCSQAAATARLRRLPLQRSGGAGGGETTTVIENELYRITFSNRGAQVISWILKRNQR